GAQSTPLDLPRGGAPHGKVAAQRHRPARDRDLWRDPGDLARPRPALQLLDAVGVHPETAATTADIATTRGDGVRPGKTDIRLVQVQGFAAFDAAVAEALQMELVEQGEAIVHVFKGELRSGDPRTLIERAPGLGGLCLDLLQRGCEAPGGGPARRMVENI